MHPGEGPRGRGGRPLPLSCQEIWPVDFVEMTVFSNFYSGPSLIHLVLAPLFTPPPSPRHCL